MDIRTLISQPVKEDLKIFDEAFNLSLKCDSAKMQSVMDYISLSNGKRIRPVMLLLSAFLSGKVTVMSIESAVLIEILHTATLIHDDVVDDTLERRGEPSVKAKFGNKVAVLAGDYLLSVALYKAISLGDLQVLSIIGRLGKYLSLGELNQLSNVREFHFSEESYLDVIREKTAMLFSACTEIGALSAGADSQVVEAMRIYGENIGMCFQIRDDIFDYYNDRNIGKPTGNDIREGKVTLPLIYALNQSIEKEREKYLDIIKRKDFSSKNIASLIQFAKDNGGIDYAKEKMKIYASIAEQSLLSFTDSEAKKSLLIVIDYVISRNI